MCLFCYLHSESGVTFRVAFRTRFLTPKTRFFFIFFEVEAFWQWSNLLHRLLPPGAPRPLLLNLDETSVSRAAPNSRGIVVSKRSPFLQIGRVRLVRHRRRRKVARGAITHVAIVCDDTAIQPVLPQVFLANAQLVSEAAARTARSPTVQIWRGGTGWNNAANMVKLFDLLGEKLRPFLSTHQPILFMDGATCHLPSCVLQAASRASIWIVQVPARLTWLLQPLDTHAFSAYKKLLEAEHRRLRREADGGDVSNESWLLGMTHVASTFLCRRRWRSAFEQNGVTGQQDLVSHSLASFAIPSRDGPTVAGLTSVFPRRRRLDIEAYFQPVLAAVRARQELEARRDAHRLG